MHPDESEELTVTTLTHVDYDPKLAFALKTGQLTAVVLVVFLTSKVWYIIPWRPLQIVMLVVVLLGTIFMLLNIAGHPGWHWLKLSLWFVVSPRNFQWLPADMRKRFVKRTRRVYTVVKTDSTV